MFSAASMHLRLLDELAGSLSELERPLGLGDDSAARPSFEGAELREGQVATLGEQSALLAPRGIPQTRR